MLLGLVWALLGCRADVALNENLFAPELSWVYPSEEGLLPLGEPATLELAASWRNGPLDELTYAFVSDVDGPLPGALEIDPSGALRYELAGGVLAAGPHTLTATAFHERAGSGDAAVAITVVPNLPPTVNLAEPASSAGSPATWFSTEPIRVRGLVNDPDQTDATGLSLVWSGSAPGTDTLPAEPDTSGEIDAWLPPMAAGTYTLSARAIDALGAAGSAAVVFTVLPSDADGDGHIGVADGGHDCDDGDFAVHPGAEERCNGIDDDCDGDTDEASAVDAPDWRPDADEDGFGAGARVRACEGPDGHVADGGDCDDADDNVHPGADERCDGVDEDCDGLVDEDAIDGEAMFADLDEDGWGDPDRPWNACPGATDASDTPGDCDDAEADVNPSAPEQCGNERDDDCDGAADEGCVIDHCGPITLPELWRPGNIHRITCEVQVHSTLTLADGVQIRFASTGNPQPGIQVGKTAPGRLLARGGLTGIHAAPEQASTNAGYIAFNPQDSGSEVVGLTLEHPASNRSAIVVQGAEVEIDKLRLVEARHTTLAGLHVTAGGVLHLTDSEITGGWSDAVRVDVGSELAVFDGNEIADNVGYPLRMPFSQIGALGLANTLADNGEPFVELLGDRLAHDAALSKLDVDYVLAGNALVAHPRGPTLSIAPGVRVLMGPARVLDIGTDAPGALRIEAADDPVIFEPVDPTAGAGAWLGLRFQARAMPSSIRGLVLDRGGANIGGAIVHYADNTLILDQVTIVDSGTGGIVAYGGGSVTQNALDARNLTIERARDEGVALSVNSTLLALEDTRIAYTEGAPLRLPADAVGVLDDTLDLGPSGNRRIEVLNSTLSRTATWLPHTGSDATGEVPYQLEGGGVAVNAPEGPVLTLTDGVVIEANHTNASISVATGASPGGLVVDGHTKGVRMAPTAAAGSWLGVSFSTRALPVSEVRGADISGARDGNVIVTANGHVVIRDSHLHGSLGAGLRLTHGSTVSVYDTVIDNNDGFGVDALAGDLVEFKRNDLSGNGLGPASLPPDAIGRLDTTSTFGDPAVDRIHTSTYIYRLTRNATWGDLGVPYQISRTLEVHSALPLVFTLGPGTTVYFEDGELRCLNAKVRVLGTAEAPVRLLGATGTPGDWVGVADHPGACEELRLEHVEIAHAGGDHPQDLPPAALRYGGRVTGAHVAIRDSAGWGTARSHAGGSLEIDPLTVERAALGEHLP